jgi:hypothetical protein
VLGFENREKKSPANKSIRRMSRRIVWRGEALRQAKRL